MNKRPNKRIIRHKRIRAKISGTGERPRLSLYRSNRSLYVQLIDDVVGKTIAAVRYTSVAPKSKAKPAKKETLQAAAFRIGEEIAAKAKEKKISCVVFDRGGYVYHGRVKALAEGARKGGLEF